MIQSAMMFALGFLVSGLLWLALSVALVRRAKTLTARRLLASISTTRVEFATERDELRARHALDMHRSEREVSRVLDMATAFRLEADVKDQDLVSLRAELLAREEDFADLQARLAAERELTQDLERRHAEAGTSLRSVQHALKLEVTRRAMAEDQLDEAGVMTDQRRLTLKSLRDEIDELRAGLGEGDRAPVEDIGKLPRILLPSSARAQRERAAKATPPSSAGVQEPVQASSSEPTMGGSVVTLPTRLRQPAPETPDDAATRVADAARDLQRIAGEAQGDLGRPTWRTPADAEPRMPLATVPPMSIPAIEAASAPRSAGEPPAAGDAHQASTPASNARPAAPTEGSASQPSPDEKANPDARFFEALAEIRALKRRGGQAGE